MWLAATSTASTTAPGCNETQRVCACMTGECRFPKRIAADEGAWIFCLHNPPLSPLHVTGSALFAFGEAEITYSGKAEVHKASEDTEFLDLTRTASAEARAREWCRHLEEVKSSWSSLLPSWSADKRTDRYSFSPHYHSCLAVCPRGEAADVQVSFRRRSPFERDRARARPSARVQARGGPPDPSRLRALGAPPLRLRVWRSSAAGGAAAARQRELPGPLDRLPLRVRDRRLDGARRRPRRRAAHTADDERPQGRASPPQTERVEGTRGTGALCEQARPSRR